MKSSKSGSKNPSKIRTQQTNLMNEALLLNKAGLLKERILQDTDLLRDVQAGMAAGGRDSFTVFLSICDGESRAKVFHKNGESVQEAFEKALHAAKSGISGKKNYKPIWVKADVVDSAQAIDFRGINKRMKEVQFAYFYRSGLAFDSDFKTAFLEAELNSNDMLKYDVENIKFQRANLDECPLSLERVNGYMQKNQREPAIAEIPKQLFEFGTRGFFIDEKNAIYELHNKGISTGMRNIGPINADITRDMVLKASRYLANLLDSEGKFTYGYYPMFGRAIDTYNIVRHASSLWSLVNLYRMTGEQEMLEKLNTSIEYMISKHVEYRDKDTAYVVERTTNEIKLGASGVAVIMLSEYMDVVGNSRYADVVRSLANGIVALQNADTGSFTHVLSFPSYEVLEEFRIVYYDGEAVFALARAYSLLKDDKYLSSAVAGVEHFIKNDYTVHCDHWVAYAMYEVTKHMPEPRFFEFAMRNVQENLAKIHGRATTFHTYLELLMISWQTYERIVESGIKLDYMDTFDVGYFVETIFKRAEIMRGGFLRPESAMYLNYPSKAADTFIVRHAKYRIRIDDIQHSIGGYYFFMVHYDSLGSIR
ncbi:MAG: glycosyl hydrolase family 88 [Defluviitaleaceae bacterium]|nr:glycosyl hydrolase family 88 [Defluviitaleaceae bacterium]